MTTRILKTLSLEVQGVTTEKYNRHWVAHYGSSLVKEKDYENLTGHNWDGLFCKGEGVLRF